MKIYIAIILLLCVSQLRAQDSTYITYSVTHDTSKTTTIPAKYIARDTSFTIFDTSYSGAYINGYFTIIDGSIIAHQTLYDTIPEHDSTFNCTLCATHDTTVAVAVIPPDEAINGMLTQTEVFTPFADRIHTTKIYSNDAMRESTAPGENWKVKQVHDSDLIDLMTYNEPECCVGSYFTTDIATALTTFENYLIDNPDDLPELISFNNEEPNFGYWKGTANDYLAWLNAATNIAHNHGIPVSNGGILHNIFWYIRYVYQQEGKTDSVNLINSIMNIGPGTPLFAQAVIDWYKVEIPGLAASQIDYVNFHNYFNGLEPAEMDLVNITIRFLGSRVGKPVITTEAGTKGATQAQFNEYFDRIRDEGVNIRVYYNGTGGLSDATPAWWQAWILQ